MSVKQVYTWHLEVAREVKSPDVEVEVLKYESHNNNNNITTSGHWSVDARAGLAGGYGREVLLVLAHIGVAWTY